MEKIIEKCQQYLAFKNLNNKLKTGNKFFKNNPQWRCPSTLAKHERES